MRVPFICAFFLWWCSLGSCTTNASCSAKVKRYISYRLKNWGDSQNAPWQQLVDDKLTGYMYAIYLGVPTPQVYACSRGIPEIVPEQWGTNSFVVKPLAGRASMGVVISDNGRDILTSLPVAKGTLEDIYRLHASRSNETKKLIFSPEAEFMVEEYLRPKDGLHHNGVPADVKFEVFDGKIFIIRYMERGWDERRRGVSVLCSSYYDEDLQPLMNLKARHLCHPGLNSRPPEYEAMKDMVLKLDRGLGRYYRIDMFLTPRGPVLGEFTAYSFGGDYSEIEACHMLEYWDGDDSPRAVELARATQQPDILRGWKTMSTMEKCERVREEQQNTAAAIAAAVATAP